MLCQGCGKENPSFHQYCYQCGGALTPTHSSTNQFRPQVSAAELQPELKMLTVLFVDITNSVHLIHKLKPEDSTAYLAPTIDALRACAHRYGGLINRVDGDGMMVIFGAPIAFEDHAIRACYAALDMLQQVRSQFKNTKIGIRIGIHSGEVLMKPFQNDFSVDYEALGPAVYLAHRMEVMASPNTAILSKETYRLAQKAVKAIDAGPTEVKGLEQAVNIYQLQSRLQSSEIATTDSTPFIGRHEEVTRFQQLLIDTVKQRRGCCFGISADPGVGKTRLTQHLLSMVDINSFQTIETHCDSHNQTTAYLTFSNLLRYWLNVAESDNQLNIAQKLRDRIARLSDSLSEYLSAFHFLLDLPIQNQTWNALEPIQKQQQSSQAIFKLLDQLAQHKPIVIVIEDLHWIDPESNGMLRQLADFIQQHPIVLVVTFRPEYNIQWPTEDMIKTDLKVFSEVESNHYLEYVLSRQNSLKLLREEISHRCEGNPLYIEEMIQHLADSKLIEGDKGDYSTNLTSLPKSLPLTIHSVIATRIDNRSALAKNILQIASVIGHNFSKKLLDYVADTPSEYTTESMQELLHSNLILLNNANSKEEIKFKHALVHQVTYEGIPRERKQKIHSDLVSAMELLYEERLEEHIYRLAEHAYLGNNWPKASQYCLQACSHAIGRSSHPQAVTLLDRGLEALRHLPLNKDTLGRRIDFLAVGMNALIPLGEQDRLVRDLREAEKLCAAVAEPKRTCSILCQLSNALWMVGNHKEAFKAASEAVTIADDLAHVPLKIAANYNLAMIYHAMGDFEDCIELEQRLLGMLSGDMEIKRMGWTGYPSVFARTFYGNSLVELGRCVEAYDIICRGVELAKGARHPYSQVMINDTFGYYLNSIGQYKKAASVLKESLQLCHDYAIPTMIPAVSAKLAEALLLSNQVEEAHQVVQTALEPKCYRRGGRYTWFYVYKIAAELYLTMGEWDKALKFAQNAYHVTQESSEVAHHGWACLTLAQVYCAQSTRLTGEISPLIDRAIYIARQKSMQLLQFHAHLFASDYQFSLNDIEGGMVYLDGATKINRLLNHEHFDQLLAATTKKNQSSIQKAEIASHSKHPSH